MRESAWNILESRLPRGRAGRVVRDRLEELISANATFATTCSEGGRAGAFVFMTLNRLSADDADLAANLVALS
jgi:hypothetical protein